MENKFELEIVIRRAKLGDEKGIIKMQREGLKRKNWNYTGSNETSKKKLSKMRESFKSKNPDSYSFVAIDKSKNKLVGSVVFR